MRLLSSLSAIAFAALATTSSFAENSDIQQELTAYNDRFNEIVANYDLEAFLALYNDAPLWVAPEKPPVAGLDVPAGTFRFIVENEGVFSHSFDHFFVSDDGTQAVMIGDYDLNVEKVGVAAKGTYLFVLARNGTQWDIVVDMYNQHSAE
ncbi:nuclear transport factor 2 family protein [Pelagibius litoralis]|uniref:Nuclear transport factor 2 family protein n=1 Tax=Pelagibius litoralis TaxID=374515 RepID=A0A967KFK3_9PROT|nr:nuclear transport factor 2 family protein [Pelagibius litoralis]NIA71385.1 nuclear transport factor 2 family protein [Pelagibius litoralis]